MWADDRASRALGMSLGAVLDGEARLTMTVRDDHVNGLGVCHGGVLFMFADSAMAFATNAANVVAVASGAEIDFVAPAHLGDALEAQARTRWSSRRTAVTDVEVRRDDGTLVALFRGRTTRLGRPVATPQD